MNQVSKGFSEKIVLDHFNINVFEGESIGIVGMYGLGKTTLFKLISGEYKPDAGMIYMNGKEVVKEFSSFCREVFAIHENTMLIGQLTVAENIFVIRKHRRLKVIFNKNMVYSQTQLILDELGIQIAAREKIYHLSRIQKYLVELVKSYVQQAKMVLVDDILSDCSHGEQDELLRVMEYMKKKGVSFVMVSKAGDALKKYCERLLFFVDGRSVKVISRQNYERYHFDQLLLKNKVGMNREKVSRSTGEVVFQMRDERISLTVCKGEVLGIYDDFDRVNNWVWGLLRQNSRMIVIQEGSEFPVCTVLEAARKGVFFMNFHHLEEHLASNISVLENICMASYPTISSCGIIHRSTLKHLSKKYDGDHKDVKINTNGRCAELSGHGMLMVYLERFRFVKAKVLICEYPYERADMLDVKTLDSFIEDVTERGTAVILIAVNHKKIANVCDRIVDITDLKRVD